jgi:hypothetical protein
MSSSLRILTFNTQLRSWAMEVGASPGYTIPPVDTAEERAGMIGDAIVNSPFDYDIAGLCEVFDEDARAILRDKLRPRFPFQITKADYDHVRVDNGTGSTENLGLLGLWHLVGLPSPITSGYRLEDSGLMLMSRWPFAMMSTAGLDPGVEAVLRMSGLPIPGTIPMVNFLPYTDTDGNDGDACKGVLYMRVQRAPGQLYHFFFSHTQADTDVLEEHKGARNKQMVTVERFIKVCTGGTLPLADEVFFMGDLNVSGEQAATARDGFEWKTYFDSLGRLLSDYAVDLWGRRQCVGAPGLRDPGFSATVRYPPQEQRLDYIFAAASSGLAAQHLMIDYDLAEVPPGHKDVSYLSDHRPLRLDLAFPRLNSTPHEALKPDFPAPPAAPLYTDFDQWLLEGQVKWYRFDIAGTYDFALLQASPRCGYEVYLDTDLSRPRRQYRKEEHPDLGAKFVLASAPFLVKVFPFSRDGEQYFTFRAHRHEGRGPEDAIQLPYGVPVRESFPTSGQILNDDRSATPWDDRDTKWFRLDGPQLDLTRRLQVTITLDAERGPAPFSIGLARVDAGVWTLLERQGPGATHYELGTSLGKNEVLYVQVQRADGTTPRDLAFSLAATTDLSLLLGGKRGAPRLLCQDETSGWGADDIEVEISVDGVSLRYIDNDAIGDFEQDAVRELNQWLPELLPYFDGIEFKVVEKDDTSPDDIGRETLRPRVQLDGWDRFSVTKSDDDRTLRGALLVDVDDGTYAFQLSVTTWDEQF